MERNFQIVSFYTFSATDYEFLLRYFVALIVYTRRENHRYTLAYLSTRIETGHSNCKYFSLSYGATDYESLLVAAVAA